MVRNRRRSATVLAGTVSGSSWWPVSNAPAQHTTGPTRLLRSSLTSVGPVAELARLRETPAGGTGHGECEGLHTRRCVQAGPFAPLGGCLAMPYLALKHPDLIHRSDGVPVAAQLAIRSACGNYAASS